MAFFIVLASIFLFTVHANQPGDVQGEIKLIKEDIKGIKDTEDMTKMTMMAFMQQVKGVDSRVTDVVKESTLMSAQLHELSQKEERDCEKVGKNADKIENLAKNVQDDHMKVEKLIGELREFKERGIVDILHPIGSIYLTFVNNEPPLNGQSGVLWELLPEGYTLMSANSQNVGHQGGNTRLDSGSTEGHTLSIDEMPSHSHSFESYDYDREYEHGWYDGNVFIPFYTSIQSTRSVGGNEAHSHDLNIMNHKVKAWRRKS